MPYSAMGPNYWGLYNWSPLEHKWGRHICILVVVIWPCEECTEWLLPPVLWVGEALCYSVSCPPAISTIWQCTQLWGLSRDTWSLHLPYIAGRGLFFQVWLHLMAWLSLNLWWVCKLVILVCWLGIRLMSLLTPGLQNGLLLIHTFTLSSQVRCHHFTLESGCEDYSILNQTVADFDLGLDSILTDSFEILALYACFDESEVISSSISSGFLHLVSTVSDSSKPHIACS